MIATYTDMPPPAIQSPSVAQTPFNSTTRFKSHKDYFQAYVNEQQQVLQHHCNLAPQSEACTASLHYMLNVLGKPRFSKQLNNQVQLAKIVLDILYNGQNAKLLFVTRLHDINSRANFFATNDIYYQHSLMPVRWFKIASEVSKECITGLGARHCASYVTFGSTKTLGNPPIYAWRQQAGDTVLDASFDNFKALFNKEFTDPVAWDINQLKHEQSVLQPIHTQYLSKYQVFQSAYKAVMHLRMNGGVDMLSLPSRIAYGCYRMGYSRQQQCGF